MSQGPHFAHEVCRLCAAICEACGYESAKHEWATAKGAPKSAEPAPMSAA